MEGPCLCRLATSQLCDTVRESKHTEVHLCRNMLAGLDEGCDIHLTSPWKASKLLPNDLPLNGREPPVHLHLELLFLSCRSGMTEHSLEVGEGGFLPIVPPRTLSFAPGLNLPCIAIDVFLFFFPFEQLLHVIIISHR